MAKSQVESFASMVKITRRISAADKASFLADSADIIGKIDELFLLYFLYLFLESFGIFQPITHSKNSLLKSSVDFIS